jgi:hypothetical protein
MEKGIKKAPKMQADKAKGKAKASDAQPFVVWIFQKAVWVS